MPLAMPGCPVPGRFKACRNESGELFHFLEEECLMVHPLNGFAIFDDKGEVKRLVDFLIQARDPQVIIDTMRKLDYSYIFTLSKRGRRGEFELIRPEIEASWDWRNGNIDSTVRKKIDNAIAEL